MLHVTSCDFNFLRGVNRFSQKPAPRFAPHSKPYEHKLQALKAINAPIDPQLELNKSCTCLRPSHLGEPLSTWAQFLPCPATKVFSEIRDEPNFITPPPKWFGGIIYIVFYRMEELSGHYKHILLFADNGRLLHHGGPNKLPKQIQNCVRSLGGARESLDPSRQQAAELYLFIFDARVATIA